jgi:hypothetical protein
MESKGIVIKPDIKDLRLIPFLSPNLPFPLKGVVPFLSEGSRPACQSRDSHKPNHRVNKHLSFKAFEIMIN